MTKKISILILLALFFSCDKEKDPAVDYAKCNLDMQGYDYTYGIDYSNPDQYLIPGEQSEMDDPLFGVIKDSIGVVPQSITGVLKVCHWIHNNFKKVSKSDIGGNTLKQLYAVRTIYDSHSAALVLSGTLRKFGFPTVILEAGSIQWAYDYRNGDKSYFEVRVMTEVYVNDKWILVDNDCTFVMDYNPENPFISLFNANLYPKGLFVYEKGVDTWDYGIRSEMDSEEKIKWFSSNIICFEDHFGTADYTWH